ncbi:MAG: tetratricopeptide repeat protein, partial [Sphingobacteriia bacterium]|nr:tetratricopeptide repeat protein [Sphingobacteriia bacterium]
AYNEGDYDEAELKYKKAMEMNPQLFELYGNTANAQYRNAKFNDAALNYENVMKMSGNRNEKADAFYNMGNSYLQATEYDKSIEAYKNAIKLNPNHDMSRYNMAVATKIQEQQQSGGGGGQGESQQDKDQQNKDKNQNAQKDKGDKGEDQNNDQDKDKQEKNQPQPKDNQMSREEMERFLESLQQQEKNVQEKVKNEKFKAQQRVVEKEW